MFAGVTDVRREFDRHPVTIDERLSRSSPAPGGAEAFREVVAADVGVDRIGIAPTNGGAFGFSFPVVAVPGVK